MQHLNHNLNCAITGRSTQNTRIERLWREVNRIVSWSFRELFYNFEEEGLIDPTEKGPMWDFERAVLTRVFLRLIQYALDIFQDTHNQHHVRGEGAPIKMWNEGFRTRRMYPRVLREDIDDMLARADIIADAHANDPNPPVINPGNADNAANIPEEPPGNDLDLDMDNLINHNEDDDDGIGEQEGEEDEEESEDENFDDPNDEDYNPPQSEDEEDSDDERRRTTNNPHVKVVDPRDLPALELLRRAHLPDVDVDELLDRFEWRKMSVGQAGQAFQLIMRVVKGFDLNQ